MSWMLLDPPIFASRVALLVLAAGMLLAFVRLARGPSLPDRVVALDLVATHLVGAIAAYSILTGEPMLLRSAIVLALLTFLGTVAFARYLERRQRP